MSMRDRDPYPRPSLAGNGVEKPKPSAGIGEISIRHQLRPGDLGSLIRLHGLLYAAECGWDYTFEAYVAGPLAEFALAVSPRNRIWIVQQRDEVAGSIAVAEVKKKVAQLRWFLLRPDLRGQGLGKELLREAVAFSRNSGYTQIELWTARNLGTAAHLYASAGFELTREITRSLWGQTVTEQKYELRLKPS